jgi:hypothetical protein
MVGVMGVQTKTVFVDSGACKPDQVRVVGAPRFDAWRERTDVPAKDALVLLSFRGHGYRAPVLFKEVLEVFVEEARTAANDSSKPEMSYVIKAKDRADRASILAMIRNPPANLTVEDATPMRPLLQRARLTIGFNSLALVEGMMTDARICIPYWGESRALDRSLLVFDPAKDFCRDAADWPSDRDQLRALIRDARVNPAMADQRQKAARDKTINSIIHVDTNVTSSELVEKMVADAIARRRGSMQVVNRVEAVQ